MAKKYRIRRRKKFGFPSFFFFFLFFFIFFSESQQCNNHKSSSSNNNKKANHLHLSITVSFLAFRIVQCHHHTTLTCIFFLIFSYFFSFFVVVVVGALEEQFLIADPTRRLQSNSSREKNDVTMKERYQFPIRHFLIAFM